MAIRKFAAALIVLIATAAFAQAETAPDPTTIGPFGQGSGGYKANPAVDPAVTNEVVTEIWARVWFPTGGQVTNLPIVVMLHGNHGTCGHMVDGFRVDDSVQYSSDGTCPNGYTVTPNHLGYDYAGRRLASNGYVVISINVNRGINALGEGQESDPGLIKRRARMILRHLQYLKLWNEQGNTPSTVGFEFKGKLDFSRVTLFGHSRGGDAIIAAYNLFRTNSGWQQALPANMKIVGLASMAPTDFQSPKPLARGTALSVLLPLCDGDVNRLSGIGFYDRTVSPNTTDNPLHYNSVFAVRGTNHNGYNTEWQTDDNYQAASHTCPGQTALFPHPLGLSTKQQTIGRYFILGVARGASEKQKLARLFNPTYKLPKGLLDVTQVDRSFALGTSAAATRVLRFDGTCSAKFSITTGVAGTCFQPAEHDPTTFIGRVRWKETGHAPNYAIFTLNNNAAVNLSNFKMLDMRVGPDCFLNVSETFTGCTGVSPTAGNTASQDVDILLQDSNNKMSKAVPLLDYTLKRAAVGIAVPGGALPNNPLYHAILSSARIPVSAFAKSGFNLNSVRKIYVRLGSGTSRGGLYFGDVWAVNSKPKDMDRSRDDADSAADGASADTLDPATLALQPASDGVESDATTVAQAPEPRAADAGTRIVSIARGQTQAPSRAGAPGNTPTIEFTVATPQPILDISDSGLTLRIGGRTIRARYISTGHEGDSPSVTKLVVPADAVDAAQDGAAIAVVSPTKTWNLGALAKGAIR